MLNVCNEYVKLSSYLFVLNLVFYFVILNCLYNYNLKYYNLILYFRQVDIEGNLVSLIIELLYFNQNMVLKIFRICFVSLGCYGLNLVSDVCCCWICCQKFY